MQKQGNTLIKLLIELNIIDHGVNDQAEDFIEDSGADTDVTETKIEQEPVITNFPEKSKMTDTTVEKEKVRIRKQENLRYVQRTK